MKTAAAVFMTGVGALLLMAAAMLPTLVGAQSTDDPSEATTTSTSEGEFKDGEVCGPISVGRLRPVLGIGPFGGDELADALGVSVEELREAAEAARESLGEPEPLQSEEELEALKDELMAAFAAALGISVEELESAIDEVMAEHRANAIERIEAAVEAGRLSRERADAIIEHIESGERPVFPRVRPGHGRFHRFDGARSGLADELPGVLLPST